MKSTPGLSPELLDFRITGSEGDEPTGTEETKEGDQSGRAADGQDDKSKGDPQKKIADLEEEKARHYGARQEAERERDELRTWKEQQERKDRTAEENLNKDLTAEKETVAQLTSVNRRLVIENAFLKDNTHQWRSSADALALTDLSELQIDEKTGKLSNPDALTAAIKKTAEAKPYLLVEPEGTGAEKSEKKDPPKSGDTPGKKVPTNGLDAETLRNRFPSLRTH